MSSITASDVAYSQIIRQAHNLLASPVFGNNPFVHGIITKLFDRVLEQYGTEIRAFIDLAASNPPESIESTRDMVLEKTNGKINSFFDELQTKINKQGNK